MLEGLVEAEVADSKAVFEGTTDESANERGLKLYYGRLGR